MASHDVVVGPAPGFRTVEATPFIHGLILHKTPDAAPPHDLYNITHRVSGLAILTHVAERDIKTVQRMLSDLCWTIMPDEIYGNAEYYGLITQILQTLRGVGVLRLKFGTARYIIMGYLQFLSFAKRGLA